MVSAVQLYKLNIYIYLLKVFIVRKTNAYRLAKKRKVRFFFSKDLISHIYN